MPPSPRVNPKQFQDANIAIKNESLKRAKDKLERKLEKVNKKLDKITKKKR
jgi:hypothetical protein